MRPGGKQYGLPWATLQEVGEAGLRLLFPAEVEALLEAQRHNDQAGMQAAMKVLLTKVATIRVMVRPPVHEGSLVGRAMSILWVNKERGYVLVVRPGMWGELGRRTSLSADNVDVWHAKRMRDPAASPIITRLSEEVPLLPSPLARNHLVRLPTTMNTEASLPSALTAVVGYGLLVLHGSGVSFQNGELTQVVQRIQGAPQMQPREFSLNIGGATVQTVTASGAPPAAPNKHKKHKK